MKYPAWLVFLPLVSCSLPAPAPPSAEFLVADAASTWWVHSGPRGISARQSPLILTRANERFYEVYVGEETRSYEDAFFSSEPIYTRDLLTGKEKLLWDDAKVPAWEKSYLAENPGARLLDSDDDEGDDVSVAATAESEILGVLGRYVLYDRRLNLEKGDFQKSDSARGALDILSGASVPFDYISRDSSVLGADGIRDSSAIRWRHSAYDVVARWDAERGESQVILRDLRGNEWPLGFVDARVPRVYWLDEPKVDSRIRAALANAFDDARADDVETLLVSSRARRDTEGLRPRRGTETRSRGATAKGAQRNTAQRAGA